MSDSPPLRSPVAAAAGPTPEVAHAALPALFIADLHLSEERAETTAAFLAFLAGPAREVASLFILGDLFEYLAGDDDLETPFNRAVCAALKSLGGHGTRVFFMRGNRDLLAGAGFARAAGLCLLPDPTIVAFGDGEDAPRLLLSHGDALCTDDLAYQAYRRQVNDPIWQAGFLTQPLAARKAFIESLRQQSESAKKVKAMEIMDVNPGAVETLLRTHGGPTLVHGHTHRPARHEHMVDGRKCVRWVLPDWHDSAAWLRFDGRTLHAEGGA